MDVVMEIMSFPVILQPDETGGFVVECPILDGCYSQGDDIDEALRLPCLRDRRTDIPILARAFLARWNLQYKEDKRIGEEAMRYLMEYSWPGNIRELRNSVISMCAMANSGTITPELLPPAIQARFNRTPVVPEISAELPAEGLNLKALLYQVERQFFRKALRAAAGNKEQAAQLLGVNAPAFRKALRERFEDVASEWAEP